MACPSCGAEVHAGQKFCSECGQALARSCPSCGTPYEGSPNFCAECGNALGGGATSLSFAAAGGEPTPVASPHSASEPAGSEGQPAIAERKQVSVLFADLVGFTAQSERRDAEEVREQLTQYFALSSEVISRYGGTVEKFIGDAVMAVWGTPVAHEDDAERAVRAALELVAAVRTLGRGGDELALRAGVLTGEAAVTVGATNQGMVAGDLVNTASRLQSVAPPGTVLVGETTYRTAARAIAFEPLGDQELKGKASPVPAYRAIRVVAQRGGIGRADQLEAPFLGRDVELGLIKDLFHATQRERRPRLVSIMGQGGIGKSRLTWEFLKYIDGITSTVRWHQGRSPAYGEGITFWALGEMVRSRAGLLESDDPPTTRAKIGETLLTFVPDEAERRWIQPRLEQLLGIGEPDGGGREELFAAWRTFFERVAGDDVAVLVFEDLHWADAGLLDFIEYLLTWARTAPILIVTLARPEVLEKRPTWGAGQRNFTSLSLEPLPEEVIREILDALVPGLPDDAAARIAERAEGIPLYAVETVRMLLQDGRLEAVDGSFRPIGELADLAVPSTLQALIAARLDALEATDRSILQQASVLGQSFTMPALAAISGQRSSLEERLMSLVRRELLVLDADPRSPERGQYSFVQALVRDVAYHTLSRRDRKVVHLAAGEYYEQLGDEEIIDATAMHYLDAYRSAPDDPGADATRRHASELLQRAAERATLLGSHDQAVRFLELALEVTTDPAEGNEVLTRAGNAAGAAGRYEIAEAYLRRAVDAARQAGDVPSEARALTALGRVIAGAGRPVEAAETMNAALPRLSALEHDGIMVGLQASLARAHMLNGDFEVAITWADRALPLAERLDMLFEIADLLVTRATALSFGGRVREGIAELQGALLLAESYGLAQTALRAQVNLSGSLGSEDPAAALRIGLEGLEGSRRTGNRDVLTTLAANVAQTAMHQGRFDIARTVIDEALSFDLEAPDRFVLQCAAIMRHAIQEEPYEEMLNDAIAFAESWDEPTTTVVLPAALGWAKLVAGEYEEAAAESFRSIISALGAVDDLPVAARASLWARRPEDARRALDDLKAIGSHGRMIHAVVDTIEAGLAAADDRLEDAAALYGQAIDHWRELESLFDLALCELDFVRFVGGERPDVLAAAEEARRIFADIPSPPFLRRLDAALGLPTG
jgi:class 3 adenylate cyclase/tetratricopeptide (TPR) repeat protein